MSDSNETAITEATGTTSTEVTGTTSTEATEVTTTGTTDATTTDATTTEALQQAMVGQLMAIIGAPDDKDVARAAEDIVQALDVRLRADRAAAA